MLRHAFCEFVGSPACIKLWAKQKEAYSENDNDYQDN